MGDIITVTKLGWRYAPPAKNTAPVTGLQDVSCYVPQGSFTGVIGPTGSGKSSLAKALMGLIPHCTAGTLDGYVRIAGMNVKSTSVSNLSLRVGYVGQDPNTQMTSATVHEEIAFPLENRGVPSDEIRARVDEVLDMLHISALRDRYTDTLSTGEKERVAIAAAIAGAPQVLILDEPGACLDEEGREDLMHAIAEMRQRTGTTVLLIEQDTHMLVHTADTVFLMVDGEIIRRTTADIFVRESAMLESVGVIVPGHRATDLTIVDDLPGAADNAAVTIDHAHFAYPHTPPSEPPQLEDVAFAVQAGSFVGITGANGSGKSTLLRLVNGTLRPTKGAVMVGGTNVASRSVTQMSRQVAFVTQDPLHMLFGGSVHDEIAYGPRHLGCDEATVDARVDEMVRLFDLYDVEDVPARTLSSGEQRAVALACALAMRTPVLLLDEPVAGLDQRLKSRFLNAVAKLNQEGTTVLMVSQDADTIERYCTHAARLDGGRLVSYGRVRGSGRHFPAPPTAAANGIRQQVRGGKR
ncbi:MAG: ABC transporter ATP-binding protein [Bifidobacterium sp.]|nr:ABC transporter ATP-binding protein [Bifidobacterium sp.]